MFQFSKYIPYNQRPTIDVTTLPKLESLLLLGASLQHFPRNLIPEEEQFKDLLTFLDMTAAFAYLIHFVVTWIFAVFLFLYYRKKTTTLGYPVIQPYTFLWCFGILNVFAVGTQLAWPTAPPWYVETYGDTPANYTMPGEPAGLVHADAFLQYPLFRNLYGHSPIVFGSFPSLHGAWPIVITIFAPSIRSLKIIGTSYVILVWWAALYLNHHFLVDLVGGGLYVAVSYYIGSWTLKALKKLFRDKMLSPSFKFGLDKISGCELVDDDCELDEMMDAHEYAFTTKQQLLCRKAASTDSLPLLNVEEV
jgi:membrane-associated phospholipid phosphatase